MNRKLAFCIILILFFASGFGCLPSYSISYPTMILEWVTPFGTPWEINYWSNVTTTYEAETGVKVRMITVDDLYDFLTRIIQYPEIEPPDIVYMPAMWIPEVANWKAETWIASPMLAIPPDDVQADVRANYQLQTAEGSSYKGITWGYPAESTSLALIYNRKLFESEIASRGETTPEGTMLKNTLVKLETNQPLTWSELTDSAMLLTKRDPESNSIIQTGFLPMAQGFNVEQTQQFISLLWSNDGEFLDLLAPEAKFNSTEGREVMQFYYDLGYVHKVYEFGPYYPWPDPYSTFGTVAMAILPEWMIYIRDYMEQDFTDLGVAPIPIGPCGTESVSVVSNWLNVVTLASEARGRVGASWDFLKWMNEPRPAGYINLPGLGDVPKYDGISITGDFLISEDSIPSRTSDQMDPRLHEDFWKKGFMDIGVTKGKSDEYFTKSQNVYEQVGPMFDEVVVAGADPLETLNASATKVEAALPMPGDINFDGIVDIYDAVHMIKDIDATYLSPPEVWIRGRSDVNDDLVVDGADITILSTNYGRTGGY